MTGLRFATDADTEQLVPFINVAYQVEKFFKIGERTHEGEIGQLLKTGHFLLLEDEAGLAACVYVEVRAERGYMGMLAVDPARQKSGIGRRMIAAAEEFCRERGCRYMDLSVVDLRTELPPLYEKFGYRITRSEPFPAEEMPVSRPCCFTVMSKELGHQ